MASSGTYVYNPELRQLMNEAYERCGVILDNLTARHVKSAIASMELMMKTWTNKSLLQWSIDLQTQNLSQGVNSFVLPTGSIDIISATLKRDGVETEMMAWSREEYHVMNRKTTQGRPDRYYTQRNRDSVTCFIWQAPENSTDQMLYYRIRALQDVGSLAATPDVPQRFYEAFVGELAARLALKWAPSKHALLKIEAKESFDEAMMEDRERSDTIIRPRLW